MNAAISAPMGVSDCPSATLDGTLQRIDYRNRKLTLVAHGNVWQFGVAPDCDCSFNGAPTMLRCYHPLDRIQVSFERTPGGQVLKAIELWE